jgi:hypothetical protein
MLLAVWLLAAVWPFYGRRDRIHWGTYSKIEQGMTAVDVKRLLGGPPAEREWGSRLGEVLPSKRAHWVGHWRGRKGWIDVGFDEGDVVQWKMFTETAERPPRGWFFWVEQVE